MLVDQQDCDLQATKRASSGEHVDARTCLNWVLLSTALYQVVHQSESFRVRVEKVEKDVNGSNQQRLRR